jgi:hypothetical protein
VALTTLYWAMFTQQWKLGFVVIKIFHFPSCFSVAILTLFTLRAFMHVIALMTRVARSGRRELGWCWRRLVASLTLGFNMLAFQWVFSVFCMIKTSGFLPVIVVMTLLATGAKYTFMFVVFLVTIVTTCFKLLL